MLSTTDKTDDYIIDFALRWARFGGGPSEDIFVNFGIKPHAYFSRLQQLVQFHPELCPDPLRPLIHKVCSERTHGSARSRQAYAD